MAQAQIVDVFYNGDEVLAKPRASAAAAESAWLQIAQVPRGGDRCCGCWVGLKEGEHVTVDVC